MPEPRLIGLNGLERHMMKTGGPLTPDQWTTLNPILDFGQIGIEADPDTGEWGKAKIGDGDTAWEDLEYFNPAGTTGGGSSALVYRALLTQSGTDAPVATVLENTIGEIVWTRNAGGDYRGTLAGGFPPAKTWCGMQDLFWDGTGGNSLLVNGTGDFVVLTIIASDDFLSPELPAAIEILVYP